MATFEPAPTYADPVIVDEVTGKSRFNPLWLRWFLKVAALLSTITGGGGVSVHNLLSGLQGGVVGEYYHLDATQYARVTSPWPMVKTSIDATETCTIPAGYQLIVSGDFTIDGTLIDLGELVIL